MFALKILGDPTQFAVCASKTLSKSSTCKNFNGQHPQGPKYSLSKKVHLGRSKLTCTTLWIVDQSSPDLFRRTREESFSVTYLSDFGYLDSFRRYSQWKSEVQLCKIDQNLAGVKFSGEDPLIFGLALKSWRIYWSLCKVSRQSADGARRSCGWLKNKQESPADAVKPARRKSMHKLLQFDVFRFISPNSISPNCQCIASRGMFSQALGLYCYTVWNPVFANYKVSCLNYKYLV